MFWPSQAVAIEEPEVETSVDPPPPWGELHETGGIELGQPVEERAAGHPDMLGGFLDRDGDRRRSPRRHERALLVSFAFGWRRLAAPPGDPSPWGFPLHGLLRIMDND
jgi:hypothetical protein